MKKGDIVEWEAVNGICRGCLVKNENGQWMVECYDKKLFPFYELRFSLSVKLYSA